MKLHPASSDAKRVTGTNDFKTPRPRSDAREHRFGPASWFVRLPYQYGESKPSVGALSDGILRFSIDQVRRWGRAPLNVRNEEAEPPDWPRTWRDPTSAMPTRFTRAWGEMTRPRHSSSEAHPPPRWTFRTTLPPTNSKRPSLNPLSQWFSINLRNKEHARSIISALL